MDMFTPRDREILEKRISGEIKDYVPNDELRHQIQKQKMETSGLNEPIILTKYPETDKYNMDEGWHRVIQSLSRTLRDSIIRMFMWVIGEIPKRNTKKNWKTFFLNGKKLTNLCQILTNNIFKFEFDFISL